MRENILGTRCMVLGSITSPTAIAMRDRGTKAGSRELACIPFGMVIEDVESGTLEHSRPLYLHSPSPSFRQFRYYLEICCFQFLSYRHEETDYHQNQFRWHFTKPTLFHPLPLILMDITVLQAARKAAEDAIHLHRVDEQVSKAVMAANRAATAARVAAVKAVQNRMGGKFCDLDV